MSYDVALFVGHGFGDPGAVANGYKENDVARMIVNKAIGYIGTNLSVLTGENNYLKNYLASNTLNLKYAISVHLNAGGGTGCEAWVPLGEKDLGVEANLLSGLSALGLPSRGIKSRDYDTEATKMRSNGQPLSGKDYYREIRQSWPGASLSILEVGFIDTKKDLDIILAKIDDIAFLIAEELCALKGITLTKQVVADPKVVYRVVGDNIGYGSYGVVDNTLKAVNEAIKKGSKVITVTRV